MSAENVPAARTARVTPLVVLAAGLVLLLVAVVIGVTRGPAYLSGRERAADGDAALAAGRQLAVNFVTMDYRSFDDYGHRVLDGAAGSFHDDYASKLSELRSVVVANKTVSTVKRAEAALVSADRDSARVIVGIVAPTSNSATSQPVDKTYRLRLDLQRSGSSWKVTSLDFVG